MIDSPSLIDAKQLKELAIKVDNLENDLPKRV